MSRFCNKHGSNRLKELVDEAKSINLERERIERESGLAFSETRKLLENHPDFEKVKTETEAAAELFLLRAARSLFSRPLSPSKVKQPIQPSIPVRKLKREPASKAVYLPLVPKIVNPKLRHSIAGPVVEDEEARALAPTPEKLASAAAELQRIKAIADAKIAEMKWGKRATANMILST